MRYCLHVNVFLGVGSYVGVSLSLYMYICISLSLYLSIYLSIYIAWDSLHARLNSHYKAWSYMKKNHKKIKAYRKSALKEPAVKRCLLILILKRFRS